MKARYPLALLLFFIILFSCKPKKAENLEEMARRSSRPEAVLVKTVKLEPSTFYHELISNGKAWSSEKAVVPFKVNGIIKEFIFRTDKKSKPVNCLLLSRILNIKRNLYRLNRGSKKLRSTSKMIS